MTNYIDNMADDDRRKGEEMERQTDESSRIQATKHIWIQELMTTVQRHADYANQQFYNGGKAFEVRTDVGLFDDKPRDFVVMTADYPAAYLYVYVDSGNSALTRRLATKRDDNSSRREQNLPPLQISMDGHNPVFHDNGQTLDFEGVARFLIEPVIRAHREA
ncbi:MAG: hypothetical protein ACJ754_10850 [Pyrinomonadaceae bacterium]